MDTVSDSSATPSVMPPAPVPLPIAIVGLGFGRWILKQLQSENAAAFYRIVAVCDLDPAKASKYSEELGVPARTYDEILADKSIPAIGLFTGPAGRANLLRMAIRAGKDVMTTKPFERDADAGFTVLEEAASLGRIIHLNSPSPLLPPDIAQIRAWQEHYALGTPVSAQISTWVGYREKPDGTWLDDPELCPVAPIFRIGIYPINDAVEIFGPAEEVYVMSSRLFTERPTPDHAQVFIRFKSGALVSILASFCIDDGAWYRNSMTLNFEAGTVYRNVGAEAKAGSTASLQLVAVRDEKSQILENITIQGTSGEYQWESFHRAVATQTVPSKDFPYRVAAGLRIIEAMAEAAKTGMPVKVRS
ncbi:MAG: Gfo/Idh/MocA family protein [Candidatus Methylacidiphilales bacterium]